MILGSFILTLLVHKEALTTGTTSACSKPTAHGSALLPQHSSTYPMVDRSPS